MEGGLDGAAAGAEGAGMGAVAGVDGALEELAADGAGFGYDNDDDEQKW